MGLGCTKSRKTSEQIDLDYLQQLKLSSIKAWTLCKQPNSPIVETPLLKIRQHVWLKLENFQTSGSFKFRGAYFTIKEQENKKIVVASTGNFAKACSFAANPKIFDKSSILYPHPPQETPTPGEDEILQFNAQSDSNLIIFAPKNVKKDKFKQIDSQIIFQGDDCVESEKRARQYAQDQSAFYASPYNSIEMVAGSCTIGQELYLQFQNLKIDLDFVFVSVGGGGLIAGIAFYLKVIKQLKLNIIGVQPKQNAAMYHILKKHTDFQMSDTVSDGTAGGVEEDSITIEICKRLVDDWLLIKEEQIVHAQQEILNDYNIVVEGAAALAYAGWQNYPVGECNCAIIICGGNVDPKKVIQQDK